MRKLHDLEDIRNSADDVRSYQEVAGRIDSVEDFSKHPDSCTCGHCGKDHDHKTMGHVPKHTHGENHDLECNEHEHHHEHANECCYGGHEHHHEHANDCCCCGHEHHHEHANCGCEVCHPHEEYCDICGESLAKCTCRMPDADKIKRVYILKNLGCANCAAKMEYKIKELPGVTYANVSFATKQLRLSAADHNKILPLIQEICTSIESDVVVVPRDRKPKIDNAKTRIYLVKNLDCANCGAKIERALADMSEVDEAVLTFTTKKLKITAENHDGLLKKMQIVADKIEEGVLLVETDGKPSLAPELEERKKAGGLFSNLSEKQILIEIIFGGTVFIITEWFGLMPETYHIYCLVFAYILLGGRIVCTAVKNIIKGNVFDENFLMTIATLGAFAIQAWEEAVGVMFFYRLGEYFEQRAVEKSRGQIMDAVDMRPEVVNLLVGDDVKIIPAADAHVGDILLVRVGDRIPLDGVVIEGESLVDTSPVTGEPVPVKRKYGDEIVSGCVNTSGMLKIRVEKVLEESMVTRILDSVENAAASKPAIDRFITRFARIYTPFVVAVALVTAVVPSLITGDWNKWIYTALTFLVISCPCALVLSVPLAFFSGIGAGSKYGILFKGGVAMEALKNIAAVVMDKTGTVTKGNFVLQHINPQIGINADELLYLCASAELVSTHPIAVSITEAAKRKNMKLVRPDKFEEIAGEGLLVYFGERQLLCGNSKLLERFGVKLFDYTSVESGSEVLVADNGKYIGQLLINDTLKPDAKEAINVLKKQGLVTAMLTGDAAKEAEAVAREAGIDEVHAQLLPQDKLRELNMLRNKYGPVMFVGDGINDAPVLAGADAGAAMGSGADAAIEAADVVFMNSEVKAIPQAIAIARATGAIAWQNVIFALAVKIIIMIAGLMGYASMWAAVFADTGVSLLCVLNSIRVLYKKYE